MEDYGYIKIRSDAVDAFLYEPEKECPLTVHLRSGRHIQFYEHPSAQTLKNLTLSLGRKPIHWKLRDGGILKEPALVKIVET